MSVTASNATDSDTYTSTFQWYVADTNRIAPIDDLTTQTYESGVFTIIAGGGITGFDATGEALTWSISGLTGATITATQSGDNWTAVLGGTIADANFNGPVTVSCTGGGATDSRTFNWVNISDTGNPSWSIYQYEVNGTESQDISTTDMVGQPIRIGWVIAGTDALAGGFVTFGRSGGGAAVFTGAATVIFPSSSTPEYVYTTIVPTAPGVDVVNAGVFAVDGIAAATLEPESFVALVLAQAAAVPAVVVVPVAKSPQLGTSGAFYWPVKLELANNAKSGPNGGIIIQKINVTWDITQLFASGNVRTARNEDGGLTGAWLPLLSKPPGKYATWYEAWVVPPNKNSPELLAGVFDEAALAGYKADGIVIDPTQKANDFFFVQAPFARSQPKNGIIASQGVSLSISGELTYYPNLTEAKLKAKLFRNGNTATGAGFLLSHAIGKDDWTTDFNKFLAAIPEAEKSEMTPHQIDVHWTDVVVNGRVQRGATELVAPTIP